MSRADDEIIAGMRESYHRSNLQELGLAEHDDLVNRAGIILNSAPDRNSLWNNIGFDPVHLVYLRKLVSQDTFDKKIRIIKKDYFSSMLYLEFFTKYVVNDTNVLDNMQKRIKQLEDINPFLDPDLGLVVRCCSLSYMAGYGPIARNDRRKNLYRESNSEAFIEYTLLRRIDPVFNAAGKLLLEQFSDDGLVQKLSGVSAINDLAAMAFIDINLALYKSFTSLADGHEQDGRELNSSQEINTKLIELIDAHEYLKAAHYSMDFTAKKLSTQPVADYIATMQPTTY